MRWLLETLFDRPLNWLHDRLCPCSYTEMIARDCTRPEPHKCRVNGPCNGLPRDDG